MDDGPAAQPVTRRTLAGSRALEGLGLFTGARSRVVIHPNAVGGAGRDGVVFRRTDLPGAPTVQARIANVVSDQRRTVLQSPDRGGARVETVEHILSAFAALGITDAVVDVDGPEIPIDDGSAQIYVHAIMTAGIVQIAGSPPAPARITRPFTVSEKGAQIDLLPLAPGQPDGCEFEYQLDYGLGSPIPQQHASVFVPVHAFEHGNYVAQIAPARTFSTSNEAHAYRKMGLFSQFTPRDLLVIGPDGPVDNALRFENEPARHKVLDMVGDLSLSGRCILGRVVAARSGHALNHELARAVASLP